MNRDFNMICSLELLSGTLATAYKGTITSLVIKDFCIDEEQEQLLFKGNILSMPEGSYEIHLISSGKEIARSPIEKGYFQLRAPSNTLAEAKSLQLDVIQSGKHIGTFLLKKESAGGIFVSALDISKDLQGIPFKSLSGSISGKRGLLRKGEEIISSVLSTKKDLGKLSELINTFSRDLYWHDHDAFLLWYPLLVRSSSKASVGFAGEGTMKMVSNVVSLLEFPLEKEPGEDFLKKAVTIWLDETEQAGVDISLHFSSVLVLAKDIQRRFPSIDLLPLMKRLLTSASERAGTARSLSDEFVSTLSRSLSSPAVSQLEVMSERGRKRIRETIVEAEDLLKRGYPLVDIIEHVREVNISALSDAELIETVFNVIVRNLDSISESVFECILPEAGFLFTNVNTASSATATSLLRNLIKQLLVRKRRESIRTIFTMLDGSEKRDEVVLNREMAVLILESSDNELFVTFKDLILSIPIPGPALSGFSEDTWAETVDPLHLKRLTGFLEVISADPKKFRDVLIHTICNLFIHKAFIPDDRLFQRNISAYLNAMPDSEDILLHYSLLKKLPVYYNEVGASGKIRDLSTEIDSWGDDPVIYFMRKQVHVNASSNNIALIEGILRSWAYHSAEHLKGLVPDDILSAANISLLNDYSIVLLPLLRNVGALDDSGIDFARILDPSDDVLEHFVGGIDGTEEARKKVILLCTIYREVFRKYSFTYPGNEGMDEPFDGLVNSVSKLKNLYAAAFASEKTQPQESLYFKRHIAFGIPSVIGTYHEQKFDALAGIFRMEESVRLTLEKIVDSICSSVSIVNGDDWKQWLRGLDSLMNLFALHGIANARIKEQLSIANVNCLRASQAADILRTLQNELTWIVELFYRTFHQPLMNTLELFSPDDLPDLSRKGPAEHFLDKASDIIIRDMINNVVGFEELDRLLNAMVRVLSLSIEKSGDPEFLSEREWNIQNTWFVISDISQESLPRHYPLLGTKAGNLAVLIAHGIPVPFGVVFSASKTDTYDEYTHSSEFDNDLKEAVKEIERRTGRVFGDAERPLFLAVRSGSLISMPGILSTILYCGMNDRTFKGFFDRTGDEWLALDSRRRFIEHYATLALGLDSGHFDMVRKSFLDEYKVTDLYDIGAKGMRKIINGYNMILQDNDLQIPSDPYQQLRESIRAIYCSWFSEKTLNYRKAMNISPYWGTSVTLMDMKAVNRTGSGASVFLTRNPLTLERMIYGETREKGTGDDIVYGRLNNLPLSAVQTRDRPSLEEINPALYKAHQDLGQRIEEAMGGIPQEIEAAYQITGETIQIWALQTRRMEFREQGRERVKDACMLESNVVGRGIGVNGGALNGIVTFQSNPERIRKIREEEDLPVILLRKETSTDDVALMPEVDGIITSTGGVTSHAAVLAQKFDLTAVVSCIDLVIDTSDPHSPRAMIGDYEISEGAPLSMDGSTGLVYSGLCTLPEDG